MALIAVIGVMAVLAIIAMSIASGAVASATFTSSTRANVQARAAADAGIDTAWSAMTHGTFYCTVPPAAGLEYVTTVTYFNAAGTELTCSGTSGLVGTPTKAVVTSIGTAAQAAIRGGADGSRRTIAALFDITVDPQIYKLDQAVFSQGSFELTNAFDVLDASGRSKANIYSNGNVSCGARVPTVEGWILAQGDFDGRNTCSIDGSIWVGGSATVSSDVDISGDLFSAGGTGPSPTGIAIGSAFIGGTVVANGSITGSTSNRQQLCSLSGSPARVCGSIISIDGSVTLSNGTAVGGGIYARGNVDVGNAGTGRVVGGNVVSSHGALSGTVGNGTAIGGYVVVAGASSVPMTKIGNPSSSCATSSGFSPCDPAKLVYPIAEIPTVLNFPTNTRVVAPPRESLPRINMFPDAGLALKWPGWTIRHVACNAVKGTVSAGWTGKLLLIADGCTSPLEWKTSTTGDSPIVLQGDLAIMNPSGFNMNSNVRVKSATAGVEHNMLWIVPSDAKLANGSDLATWTTPIPSDPSHTAPTCNGGGSSHFGDVQFGSGVTLVDTKSFIYTPCEIAMSTDLSGFKGQMYAGTTALPSNSTFYFSKIDVPGATSGSAVPVLVDVDPTARFDVKDGG